MIAHNRPSIGEEEMRAVTRVLTRQWLIYGEEARALETSFLKLIGTRYALALNSGVSALHLALIALSVGPGDEIIIPTYTCASLMNAVRYTGATPILADVAEGTVNIDPRDIEKKRTKKTKALIAPHTFGIALPVEDIEALGIPWIEDCAIGLGSTYKGKQLGSFGTMSIFSLYATKMIAAGQGGLLVTNTQEYIQRAKQAIHTSEAATYAVRYNYLLPDVAASIANAQLRRLPEFLSRRKEISQQYRSILKGKTGISCIPAETDSGANQYRFILRFSEASKRNAAKEHFLRYEIATIVPIEAFQLLHTMLGMEKSLFVHAEQLAATTLSLPIYPGLTDAQVATIVSALEAL